MQSVTHDVMRRHNLTLVLGNIVGHWPIAKAELARLSGLSWGAVTSLTEELLRRGLIQSTPTKMEGRGRNPALFRVRGDARYCLGLDLGVTTLRLVVLDLGGNIVETTRASSPVTSADPDKTIDHCCMLVRKLIRKHRLPREKLFGLGLGISGSVDVTRGVALSFANLARWNELPMAERFAARLQIPIVLDRSGNCVAYAEKNYGTAVGLDHVVCLSMGEGISAGFVLNGTVYRGFEHAAGEIGQIVMNMESPPVRFIEQVSNRALTAKWRKLTGASATAEEIHAVAMAGNVKARGLFEEIGAALGIAVGNLVNLLNPQRIILGGRLANSRPLFESAMWAAINQIIWRPSKFDVQTSQLREMDVAIGAAALPMERAFTTGKGLFD